MKCKLAVLFSTAFLFSGCNQPGNAPKGQIVETYIPDSNSVGFDIAPAQGSDSSAWIGTYSSGGKTAHFRFELGPARKIDSKDFSFSSGQGRFVALDGSDASVLLRDLGKALEAKRLPENVVRAPSVPFAFAVLGDKMSQASSNGGFNVTPPGNWTAIKIFMGEGDKESEFFLNLNPVIKKGQFSIKDEEYGDEVLAQLAKVL